MPLFRNATIFQYADDAQPVSPTDLEFVAANYQARSPEKHEGSTMGFVPALWRGALERIHVSDRFAMAAVRIEQKRVPPSLWREDTARRCGEFAAREGREPSRDECATLKAASFTDLLARAFPRARVVRVLFAPGVVVVGTANKSDVDEVTGFIRQALGTFKVIPVRQASTTRTVLTHWVKRGAPHDRETQVGFHLGEAALLKGRQVKGEGPAEVVSLKNASLRSAEVEQHIEHQKDVHKVAFLWRMSDEVAVSGSIDQEFVLRSLKTVGAVADTGDAEDAAAIYAAEFFAEAAVLEALIVALRSYLVPGDGPRPAGESRCRRTADMFH